VRHALNLHPQSQCEAVAGLEVDIARPQRAVLELTYRLTGTITDLYLPSRAKPARTDELWRHTCFEAFVRPAPGEAYFEFNVAPSRQWAAYRFDGYRAGMGIPGGIDTPAVEVRTTAARCVLRVSLGLGALADLPVDADWRIGVSAVIEEMNGRRSYWALTHPPGKADFHHADGFALEIPRAGPR
jgi:hypothetical protein